MKRKQYISEKVFERAKLFHTDSAVCAVAALGIRAKACTILRESALKYYSDYKEKPEGIRVAKMFGSNAYTNIEKAIAANVSAAQDLNSNGFSLGYSHDEPGKFMAGEIDYNR